MVQGVPDGQGHAYGSDSFADFNRGLCACNACKYHSVEGKPIVAAFVTDSMRVPMYVQASASKLLR
jgi:hypothetical protein